MTYSASDTSPAYCMGLMWMDAADDPMDISAWHKVNQPVLKFDPNRHAFIMKVTFENGMPVFDMNNQLFQGE